MIEGGLDPHGHRCPEDRLQLPLTSGTVIDGRLLRLDLGLEGPEQGLQPHQVIRGG